MLLLKSNGLGGGTGCNHMGLNVQSDTYLATCNGKVGIGTSAPDFPLSVFGTNIAQGDSSITAHFIDKSSFAAGVGGGISFGGYFNSSTYANSFASIQGIKENGTSGDYAGALKFGTRVNGGSVTERLRISSTGVTTFACQVCAKRFIGSSTIGFGGLITGTQSAACQSIESLWALASNRSTATKGFQYGNGTWYIQGYTAAGAWIYYKFMIHDPVWFRANVSLANYADASLRKGCLQYSVDNSASWVDLANATNWQYSGTLDGSIALSGDSRYITLRWDSGGGVSSLVGWNSVEFTACGSAFYSVNGLG
jgi:hypothetical protein